MAIPTPLKTNMTLESPPFESIEHGDFSHVILVFWRVSRLRFLC